MEMEPQTRKTLLALTILGVIAGWLSLPPAYANWPTFVELVLRKSAISVQIEKRPVNEPTDRNTVPVQVLPPESKKTESVREPEPLQHVGGIWRSRSGLVYFFVHTDPTSFDIYQETPDNQQKIGSGKVTTQGVKATIKTLKEGRWAALDLQFSADGNTLTGTFSGMAEREKNLPLTLSKEA